MMHGHGKSDEAIVAAKPANGAAGAGLERVREVAKAKKERFTALFHHLSLEHLEMAFFELEEKAAAGVDGLTWRSYAADLEGNLEDLHGGSISRSRMDDSARSRLPHWRTRSSNGRQRRF